MRSTVLFLILGITLSAASCKKDEPALPCDTAKSTSINKILPLGASRVEGARPDFESYRYELWKRLKNSGRTFDFIGSQCDGASYPDFDNTRFDTNHEGRGGWTSGQIKNGLESWLQETGAPDIVLLSSPGGNDALEGLSMDQAISNVNQIIDMLQEANPKVIIVIEQMAPAQSEMMTGQLAASFEQMQQAVLDMARDQSDDQSRVLAVDMFTGFDDSHLADDVHYNEKGARFIADRYYQVLLNEALLE